MGAPSAADDEAAIAPSMSSDKAANIGAAPAAFCWLRGGTNSRQPFTHTHSRWLPSNLTPPATVPVGDLRSASLGMRIPRPAEGRLTQQPLPPQLPKQTHFRFIEY